jgi:hypothetical protein
LRSGLIIAVAFVLASSRARAGDLLEAAATFDPTVRFGDVAHIEIQPIVEARWTGTEALVASPSSVTGFSVPRARLVLTAGLFDFASARLRIGTKSDGSATFEQAYVEGRWKWFRARGGQFNLFLNAGEEAQAQSLSTVDYASYSNMFAGGQTQGLELAYSGPARIVATIGNGARTGFSELLSPIVADFATTGRVEIPIGEHDDAWLDSMPSFRKRRTTAARLAAIGHYQRHGPQNDVLLAGGDATLRGRGFSVIASATYARFTQLSSPLVEQAGLLVFGSLFLSRRVETWVQFDAIWPLGSHAPLPADVASGQPGTTLFRTISTGASYYIVPDSHRLKIQIDVDAHLDAQTTSAVPPNAALGVLAAGGPQVAMRVQVVMSL